MDKPGLFGEVLEKGQSAISDTTKAVKGQLTGFGKATKNQVAPDQESDRKPNTNQSIPETNDSTNKEYTKDMVKHLYGVEDSQNKDVDKSPRKETSSAKTKDEKRIQELKQKLHSEYYQRLVHPPKQKEERPAEKVEREKAEEMQELEQKEAKKPTPLAVKRAQTSVEINRGVSG